MVPLANAWRSGAWQWTSDQLVAYANDLAEIEHLVAVTDNVNASKGDRGPDEWLPPDSSYRCTYAEIWVAIKIRWDLTATPIEASTLRSILESCPS